MYSDIEKVNHGAKHTVGIDRIRPISPLEGFLIALLHVEDRMVLVERRML